MVCECALTHSLYIDGVVYGHPTYLDLTIDFLLIRLCFSSVLDHLIFARGVLGLELGDHVVLLDNLLIKIRFFIGKLFLKVLDYLASLVDCIFGVFDLVFLCCLKFSSFFLCRR